MAGKRPRTESLRARAAFNDFLTMGDTRSLLGLHQSYMSLLAANGGNVPTTSYAQLRVWSSAFEWEKRAQRALAQAEADATRAEARKWAKRRADLREREHDASQALLEKAREMLEWPLHEAIVRQGPDGIRQVLIPQKWTARDVASYLDTASKLGRLASELHTEAVQISGKLAVTEVLVELPADVAAEYADTEEEKASDDDSDDGDEE